MDLFLDRCGCVERIERDRMCGLFRILNSLMFFDDLRSFTTDGDSISVGGGVCSLDGVMGF